MKSPEDLKRWIIDPPAVEVIRHILALCLGGKGPLQIAKLNFCAAKSLKPNQEFHRCSKYKDSRGECTIYYFRKQVLSAIVLKAVQELAEFVQELEPVFLYLMEKNKTLAQSRRYPRQSGR